MSGILLYTTWPDEDGARACATALIEERLAACANILPAGRSLYRWDGAVRDDAEHVMFVKTSDAKAAQAQARILALHPYDTPCVTAFAIDAQHSNPTFLAWVDAETA